MFRAHTSLRSLVIAALASACGGPGVPNDAGTDGGRADTALAATCRSDEECDDRAYCTGTEHCVPTDMHADGFGCVAGSSPCMTGQTCDEPSTSCTTICSITHDADHDGANAIACGGDDCDDADPTRRPGNLEVCDEHDVDEDCDGSTFGARDLDGDMAIDDACCNGIGATRRCGTDCNDASRLERPSGSEVCDGRDEDCDGMVDEGVLVSLPLDADRDLHGAESGTTLACPGAVGVAAVADDCHDDDPSVHTAQVEIRNGVDDDCDGTVDEDVHDVTFYRDVDGDGFGSAGSGVVRSDVPVTGYVLLATDCDDSDPTVSPLAHEACNGRDDDCNGIADFAIAPGDYEDDDHDGSLDARCPSGDDCADADPTIHPGAIELCDARDNDCDTRADEDVADATWWLDRDGDGFGDTSTPPIVTCALTAGRVVLGGDCDDDDASVAPARLDDCARPGVDDDCDVHVDEGGALVASYRDADGDGYGAGAPVLSCSVPTGDVDANGDCDDTNAMRSPGLPELCTSGIDDDCDMLVDCADPVCTGTSACITSFDLVIQSGNAQHARVDEALPTPIVVCVSASGSPAAGRAIDPHPPNGTAVAPMHGTSGVDGCVSFAVTLGRVAGAGSIPFGSPLAATITATTTTDVAPATSVHTITNLAHTSGAPSAGAAITGALLAPSDVVETASGDVYVADESAHVVVHVAPSGALDVVAGTGVITGRLGDGGTATSARLIGPAALALDGTRLFVADRLDHRVRVVDLGTGLIDTWIGTGNAIGDHTIGIPGNAFALSAPRALAISADRTLWVGDDSGASPFDVGGVSIVGAVSGACASCPRSTTCTTPPRCAIAIDDGELLYTSASVPSAACVASDGLAYSIVRGSNATVVGGCRSDGTGLAARVTDLALDGVGNLLVADGDGAIVRIDRASGAPTHLVGGAAPGEHVPDGTARVAPVALASTTTEIAFVDGVSLRVASGLDRPSHDVVTLRPMGATARTGVVTLPITVALDAVDGSGTPVSGLVLDADLGAYGRWLGATTTDASGHASLDVRSWITPRTFDAALSARDLHGVASGATTATFTITTHAPSGGTILTLLGAGTVPSLELVATHAALPVLGDVVGALAISASPHVFVEVDGTLLLPGVRIDASGVAHAGVPWAAAGARPDVVGVDPSGAVFVRSYSADYLPVDTLARWPASGGTRSVLPRYLDTVDVPSPNSDEQRLLLSVTQGGRLFEGWSELDPATGAALSRVPPPSATGAANAYQYTFVEPRGATRFWVDGMYHSLFASGSFVSLISTGSSYTPGAAPMAVPMRDQPTLADGGASGVLLLASHASGVACSGTILRLAFASTTYADGTGTSSLVAGSLDGSTTDASDGIAASRACLDTPSIVGIDGAGHVYFVDVSPPRVRLIW